MIYLYTMEMCGACDARKKELRESSTEYIERKGTRLKADPRIMDDIDKEAHLRLHMQNLTFPVEVDIVQKTEEV